MLRICTFTYDHISSVEFNKPLWSISTEVQFYIAVPFLYSWLHRYLNTKLRAIFSYFCVIFAGFCFRCIVWIALYAQVHNDYGYAVRYWYLPLIMNLDLFLCGFLVNGLMQSWDNFGKRQLRAIDFIKKLSTSVLLRRVISVSLVILLYFFSGYHLYHHELGLIHISDKTGIRASLTFFILPILTALVTCFFIFAFESGSRYVEKYEKLSLFKT